MNLTYHHILTSAFTAFFIGYALYVLILDWFTNKIEALERDMVAQAPQGRRVSVKDAPPGFYNVDLAPGIVMESGLEDEESVYDQFEEYERLEENLFKVWALIKTIVDRSLGPKYKVVVSVVDDGVPVAVYPEDAIAYIDDDHLEEYGVIIEDGNLFVNIGMASYKMLVDIAEDGEKALVRSQLHARLLYSLTKEIVQSTVADERIAAYIAYKTIYTLVKEGVISMERQILDKIPFESEDLKAKIREQVKLENEYASKSKN